MTIIACSNLKGGEGKTTLAWHLCHAAIDAGIPTLAVDLDPQANLSTALRNAERLPLTAGALFDPHFARPMRQSSGVGLHLIAADPALSAVAELREARKDLVRRASSAIRAIGADYALVVVDTPTNAPLCYLTGLAAADGVVSPVQMDAFGLKGAQDMLAAVKTVKAHYNPRLRQLGFVVNRFNRRARSHAEMLAAAQAAGLPLLKHVLGQRQAVQDSLSMGVPVWRGRRADRKAAAEFRGACAEMLAAGCITIFAAKNRRAA